MKVKDLLSALPEYSKASVSLEPSLFEVTALTADSRQVIAGSVFVAIRGSKSDGHQYLPEVIAKNPAVLVVQETDLVKNFSGLVFQVKNSREALDLLASRFFGDPSHKLFCLGVTGTNGKTSCTYIMEHILNSMGFPTGVIGTINHHLGPHIWPTSLTTPGPLDLHKRLDEMKQAGAKAIAMEVSSHALDQFRADGVHFNTVLFTNLTHDHLDYHGSLQKYFQAKQRLFTDLLWKSSKVPLFSIVNIDDPFGRKLRMASICGLWTYGKNKKADFSFEIVKADFQKTEFNLVTPFGKYNAVFPMCGEHNIYNLVGCVAAAASMGIPVLYSLRAAEKFSGVPGRLQTVPNQRAVNVFVDYAHTPDGLEKVLQSLTEIKKANQLSGKILTVFGCGGDRDRTKRPIMAAIAEKYSDEVIVTSDNPRTEDPFQIINEINTGFAKMRPIVEVDRKIAIQQAIQQARSGDVVLIAGKGHEDYQQIGNEKLPFSDYQLAREILN